MEGGGAGRSLEKFQESVSWASRASQPSLTDLLEQNTSKDLEPKVSQK